jgi:DHA3 family multidrug efflux protein-like MFS transporter
MGNRMPRTFLAVAINSAIANVITTAVWFAVTFWVYLETQSVTATSILAGIYVVIVACSGFLLGSLVDRFKQKTTFIISMCGTLVFYSLAALLFVMNPPETFRSVSSIVLWVFLTLALLGSIVGNLRGIALSTLVTLMIDEDQRDRANGLVGTINGSAMLIASVISGVVIGFLGMVWMLAIACAVLGLLVIHIFSLSLPAAAHHDHPEGQAEAQKLDLRGTLRTISLIPGLFGLIFFQTFNNFLGGVFMSLLDAYGLSLMSVQAWGFTWGILSTAFILGGIIVSRYGLGKHPLRLLFQINLITWTVCIFFTIQSSIPLLGIGIFFWMALMPIAEAAEQTILQKVVPVDRQGRVFGFAQSVELSAAPLTAFCIGPITDYIFIPFMTTGRGVELIGSWYGIGNERGMALVFSIAGLLGLIATLITMRTHAYRTLSKQYSHTPEPALAT